MAWYRATAALSPARASGLLGSETRCSWTRSSSEATPHSAPRGMGVETRSVGQEKQRFELSRPGEARVPCRQLGASG